ncbi:RNA polymerase Rpc34 subunit-domain-containing protein [Cubamyces lactineus]|nr:RNA polymerase Rpc34 subunit-domain-containing protein [Cubamyces lactineus]
MRLQRIARKLHSVRRSNTVSRLSTKLAVIVLLPASTTMSRRQFNATERRLHQYALERPEKVCSATCLGPVQLSNCGYRWSIKWSHCVFSDSTDRCYSRHTDEAYKVKTQLHQTIVDKCLKSLTQKQLVKTVTDVWHSTRKIYMHFSIEPSVEMTGGPWYTDKELDTEFFKLLSDVCLKIVRDRSLPKARHVDDGRPRQLNPLAHASYPIAEQI